MHPMPFQRFFLLKKGFGPNEKPVYSPAHE